MQEIVWLETLMLTCKLAYDNLEDSWLHPRSIRWLCDMVCYGKVEHKKAERCNEPLSTSEKLDCLQAIISIVLPRASDQLT
ncbi:unnamed protein product [Musa acuminata subsp. burmannicoides]